MPDAAADERIAHLLEGLNDPQREAVTHPEGPLLVLAGAGSGKTRVLTHRLAWLIQTGRARPGEILAITFTNKAAQEMRERVELLLGHSTRAMWVMTFHSACARILRAEAPRLGYTRQYTIYDQSDSRRLVKQCLDELGVDPKRFTPAAVQHQISAAKNQLRDAAGYRELVGSYFEQTVADAYELYESSLHRMNAMDFDDLLGRTVDVLRLFPEVRARYQATFRHVLVDEYQDTNHAQYVLLQLIAGEHGNLMVVGDDAQCLVEGTLVTMADGTRRPIEEVRPGDAVRSCYGSGDFRPARVTSVHRSEATWGTEITLRSGRRVVSTPDHTHFAGFRRGISPQSQMTYVMHRGSHGFRVGTSRMYTDGVGKPILGRRASSDAGARGRRVGRGDAETESEARVMETQLSLRYQLAHAPVRRPARTQRERPRTRPGADRPGLLLPADHRLGSAAAARLRTRRGTPAPHPPLTRGAQAERHDHALRAASRRHSDAPGGSRRTVARGSSCARERRAQRATGEGGFRQLAL